MKRIGEDLGAGRSRKKRGGPARATTDPKPARNSGTEERPATDLGGGETLLAPARRVLVREAWGTLGDMADAGNVALSVTDRRILFHFVKPGRRHPVDAAILRKELSRRDITSISVDGKLIHLHVDHGSLTVVPSGLSGSSDELVWALGDVPRSNDRFGVGEDLDALRQRFADLPGTHLGVEKSATSRDYRLVHQRSGTVISSYGRTDGGRRRVLQVDGRAHEFLRKGKPGFFAPPCELVELSSRERLLQIDSINFNGVAKGIIKSETHRYTFPVLHARNSSLAKGPMVFPWRSGLMLAIDERGNQMASYRYVHDAKGRRRSIGIVVPPDQPLTVELIAVLSVSAGCGFLKHYFEKPGGGA